MSDQKISALMALSLLSSPMALCAEGVEKPAIVSTETASTQASWRRFKTELVEAPRLQAMGTYVGVLAEKWHFPSDHLPIGMTLDHVEIASWNVLDSKYMSWVTENDSQGLKGSLITDEHVPVNEQGLTLRDQHVADLVLEMLTDPEHPRAILTLQEVGKAFLKELKSKLPAHFTVICHFGNATVIDLNQYKVKEAKAVSGIFSKEAKRSVQDVTVEALNSGKLYRFVNAHIPGDPDGPARYEYAQYLSDSLDPNVTTIGLGDMNFNELEMADALLQAASPYLLYTPYCTNISPRTAPDALYSKAIDHFIVYSPEGVKAEIHRPEEVLLGLGETVSLLQD